MQQILLEIIVPILLAVIAVSLIHPKLVKIAVTKSIVDNPNARRLNKYPVPVLGGMGVFVGVLGATCIASYLNGLEGSFCVFAAASMMLYTGLIDDILGMKAIHKLILQIAAVAILVIIGGYELNNLHGLWGVWGIPQWLSLPLTFVACVGLINGINLIDGVDGLSSGFGILTSLICGILFFMNGDTAYSVLCFSILGSLIPFFMHNVFGRKFKMFMGDSGSLVLGLLFSVVIMRLDQTGGVPTIEGVVSFILAVFALPIFDTIRVMIARMMKGKSPFSPDKTHLHHLFIDLGYSHVACTMIVLSLSLSGIVVWLILELIPAVSVNLQFYIVVLYGFGMNLLIYGGVSRLKRHNPEKYGHMKENISSKQIPRTGVFKAIQKNLDNI